eukprot:6209687-Pleurochrysis_carterae.AAC.1
MAAAHNAAKVGFEMASAHNFASSTPKTTGTCPVIAVTYLVSPSALRYDLARAPVCRWRSAISTTICTVRARAHLLSTRRRRCLRRAVRLRLRLARTWVARASVVRNRCRATLIQRHARGRAARRGLTRARRAAVSLQARARAARCIEIYVKTRRATVSAQAAARGLAARKA